MEYKIIESVGEVDWSLLSILFKESGWGYRPPNQLERAFSKSEHICLIATRNSIIGVGRIISDGEYYAAVYDLLVHPDFQSQGFGSLILQNLLQKSNGMIMLNLTATHESIKFYEKHGFKMQNSAMLLPANETQEKCYCK